MLPWDVAIYAVGFDDEYGIPVGQKIVLYAIQRQSVCTIVRYTDENIDGGHDFKCDKVVASVINRMNAAKYVEEYQYSGETGVNGIIGVEFHDSTLDPSDVFTQNNFFLNDMEALATALTNQCSLENVSDNCDQENQTKNSYLDFMP